MAQENWIEVGKSDSIDMEDLIRFDYGDKTFCVYIPSGNFIMLLIVL